MGQAVREGVAVTHPTHHVPGVSVHLLPAQGPVVARPRPPAGPRLRLPAELGHHHRPRTRAPVTHAQTLGHAAARALGRVQAVNASLCDVAVKDDSQSNQPHLFVVCRMCWTCHSWGTAGSRCRRWWSRAAAVWRPPPSPRSPWLRWCRSPGPGSGPRAGCSNSGGGRSRSSRRCPPPHPRPRLRPRPDRRSRCSTPRGCPCSPGRTPTRSVLRILRRWTMLRKKNLKNISNIPTVSSVLTVNCKLSMLLVIVPCLCPL